MHLSSEEDVVQPRAENPGQETNRSPEESSLPTGLRIEQRLLSLHLGDELVGHFLDFDAELVELFLHFFLRHFSYLFLQRLFQRLDNQIPHMKKPPEGGVIKLRVRTLLTADSEAMSHFCIHIKYVSRCYPPTI